MENYKNILIINTFGIGDVLFSTPMVRALKKGMPETCIDFVCNERCRYIVENNKNIDNVLVFEKDEFRKAFRKSKSEFIKMLFSLIKKLKKKRYELAIDLSLGYQISLFLKLLGIKKRIGFNYRNRGRFLTAKLDINGFNDKHAVDYYLDILKLIGINETKEKNLELELPPEAEEWADDFRYKNQLEDKILVGVAPGGGKSWGRYAVYRRWSPQNFSYVARQLYKRRKDFIFLVFGSEEEKPNCGMIRENLGDKAIDLCGELPLLHSIALIKKCRLLLCNDGGILHIGVSQNIDTISIFGPVDDKVYGPYPPSERHNVVKAEGLDCKPCYRNFKHKVCETHDCLRKIDRNKVLELAEESLGL